MTDLTRYSIGILPWLHLGEEIDFGSYRFIPSHDNEGQLHKIFRGFEESISKVLSPYLERWKGKVFGSCAVVIIPDSSLPWMFDETKFEEVGAAISALFLAAISLRDCFQQLGSYANDSMFRLIVQRFLIPPEDIAIVQRRREGSTTYAGIKYEELKFSKPYECRTFAGKKVRFDLPLLRSIEKLPHKNSGLAERLNVALPFFRLANTDTDNIPVWNELFLLASAFESLLQPDRSEAKALATEVHKLFHRFGEVSLQTASASRTLTFGEKENADWVHRRWSHELYLMRGMIAHGNSLSRRSWTWSIDEHLIMGSYVFPLAVKLVLAQHGLYEVSPEDEGKCVAIDHLLAATEWHEPQNDKDHVAKWVTIKNEKVNGRTLHLMLEKSWSKILKKVI